VPYLVVGFANELTTMGLAISPTASVGCRDVTEGYQTVQLYRGCRWETQILSWSRAVRRSFDLRTILAASWLRRKLTVVHQTFSVLSLQSTVKVPLTSQLAPTLTPLVQSSKMGTVT